jgi:PKD repeat protein
MNKFFAILFFILLSFNVSFSQNLSQKAFLEEWRNKFDATDTVQDMPIAIDASGCIYVGGTTQALGKTNYDVLIVKYDKAGNVLWSRTFNVPGNGNEQVSAIAVDNSCNVYITGTNANNPATNYQTELFALKYDGNGNLLWSNSYIRPIFYSTAGIDITCDLSGNAYVLGETFVSATGAVDIAILKYSLTGALLIENNDGSAGTYNEGQSITLDKSGNIFVAAKTTSSTVINRDYLTVKYNNQGKKQWSAIYNGPGNSTDEPSKIITDANGNAYVTGGSAGSGTDFDYTTIKYSSSGSLQWIQRYDGSGHTYDKAMDLKIDNNNIYITGMSVGSSTGRDFATISYKHNGVINWVNRYDGGANGLDNGNALVVDVSGNVYVTGDAQHSSSSYGISTIMIDNAGKLVNDNFIQNCSAKDIALDNQGGIYMTCLDYNSPGIHFLTVKYDFIDVFSSSLVSVQNEMLYFKYQAVLDYIVEILSKEGDLTLDQFEKQLNFFSLRSDLLAQEKTLVANGLFTFTNDPDNFFIISSIERTILNPNLEIRVNNSIFKFINQNTLVEITDASLNTLTQLRNGNLTVLNSPNVIVHQIGYPPVLRVAGCSVDFDFKSTSQSNTMDFTAVASGSTGLTYDWDYGDGQTDKDAGFQVTHTYGSYGTYDVTVTVSDGATCTTTSTKTVNIGINVCTPNFTFDQTGLDVKFTNTSDGSGTFEWDFGDLSGTSTDMNPTYTYRDTGTYTVCLTMTCNGVATSYCHDVHVTYKTCECQCRDVEKTKYFDYDGGNQRIKCVAWTSNNIFYRGFGSKTINYRKKHHRKHFAWRRSGAEEVYTDMVGTYWLSSGSGSDFTHCSDQEETNQDLVSDDQKGKIKAEVRTNPKLRFGIKFETLEFTFKVKFQGNWLSTQTTKLSDQCRGQFLCK